MSIKQKTTPFLNTFVQDLMIKIYKSHFVLNLFLSTRNDGFNDRFNDRFGVFFVKHGQEILGVKHWKFVHKSFVLASTVNVKALVLLLDRSANAIKSVITRKYN